MNSHPNIIILAGGVGPEREISLMSGSALLESLSKSYQTDLIDLNEQKLPADLCSKSDLVFPIIHGVFGEDGQLQQLLDDAGINYCGSDTLASQLCMNKYEAKKCVSMYGVRVPRGIQFQCPSELNAKEIVDEFGEDLIIKPIDQGSSVSLFLISGKSDLEKAFSQIDRGNWILEERIFGREVTIGVLDDHSLGIVEVIPTGGVYDYKRKYTPGSTEYKFPAIIDPETETQIKEFAVQSYQSCGCRDFARVDFMICEDGHAYFLEINTLPGLTQTSLLPKSASASGYNFDQLTKKLITPGLNRFLGLSANGESSHAA
jgi:D-alanine-D-alanine ligase